jgi:hypothetical protein
MNFDKQLTRDLNRAFRMGHMLIMNKITHSPNRRGAFFKFRCCECGGELTGRIYADGDHDIGGEVLAMECTETFG